MFADLFKSWLLVVAATLPPLIVIIFFAMGEGNRRSDSPLNLAGSSAADGISLKNMKESLANDRRMLARYEREQSALRAEVIKQRKLFQEDQGSKERVGEVEQTFIAALARVHEMRHSVEETDIAITEAVLGEKVLRMPELPANGFSETTDSRGSMGGSSGR